MADIPETLKWGTATGTFSAVSSDAEDPGRVPDMTMLEGTVTFTPSVRWVQVPGEASFYLEDVVAPLIEGVLHAPGEPETAGVPLVATSQPGSFPELVQWTASFQLSNVPVVPSPVLFNIPAGGTVDLSAELGAEEEVPYVVVVSAGERESAQVAADAAAAAAAQAAVERAAAALARDDAEKARAGAAAAQAGINADRVAAEAAHAGAVAARAGAEAAQSGAIAARVGAEAAQAEVASAVQRLPYAMAQGRATITPSSVNTPTGASVLFPVDRFTVAPRLQVTAATVSPGTGVTGVGYASTSVTGTTIYLTRADGLTATPVDWLAVQMTPTTVTG